MSVKTCILQWLPFTFTFFIIYIIAYTKLLAPYFDQIAHKADFENVNFFVNVI